MGNTACCSENADNESKAADSVAAPAARMANEKVGPDSEAIEEPIEGVALELALDHESADARQAKAAESKRGLPRAVTQESGHDSLATRSLSNVQTKRYRDTTEGSQEFRCPHGTTEETLETHITTLTVTASQAMVRGTSISAVLRTLVSGMARSPGSLGLAGRTFTIEEADELWARSWPELQLDEFVSHCWRDSATEKIMAILLHYNGRPAIATSCLSAVILTSLRILGLLPTFYLHTLFGVQHYAPWAFSFGTATFVVVLCTWHHLPRRIGGSRRRAVFFDQLCVHQSDVQLKRSGIRAIGGFVASSRQMLLVWSPSYFQRLWCTLEVAAMILIAKRSSRGLHSEDWRLPLVFIAQPLAAGMLKMMVGLTFIFILGSILSAFELVGPMLVWPIALLICFPFQFHTMQVYVRSRMALMEQLDNFSVQEAECFSHGDLELLRHTIEHWFGSLPEFDVYVRTVVRRKINKMIGSKNHIPLYMLVISSLPIVWYNADYIGSHNRRPNALLDTVNMLTAVLVMMSGIELTLAVAHRCLRHSSSATGDIFVSLAAGLFMSAVTFALAFVCKQLQADPRQWHGGPAAMACVASALLFFVIHVMWPKNFSSRSRTLAQQSSEKEDVN